MPKASKRQKEKKADFQKTKLKLGKGKQAANNATDVSFKAKTIALPQQSINVDKSGKLVNSRNLTITDLALQLRHYSAGVRRDAVSGIKEILTLHPSLILTDAASLIPELARCIGDEDAAVRKQLHVLLSWMLPQIPAQLLGPYHGTLLLFTTSALSHIYPEVRIGAVKILDVCLSILPQVATAGWENAVYNMASAVSSAQSSTGSSDAAGPSKASHQPHGERIMNCYLNLLGITHRSSAAASITSIDLAPGAKLLILQSLRTFLSHALPSTSGDIEDTGNEQSCPTWFFRSAFASSAEFEYFQRILGRHSRSSRSRSVSIQQMRTHKTQELSASQHGIQASYADWPAADRATLSLMDLDSTSGKSLNQTDLYSSLQAAVTWQSTLGRDSPTTGSGKLAKSAALSLYALLDPVLLASFLDTAPSAFQPDLDLSQQTHGQNAGLSTPAQLVFEIVSLMLALWRGSSSPSSKARTSLADTLGHISVYFPFSHHTGSSGLSAKAKSAVVQMDLAYAELAALLALNEAASQKIKSKFNVEVQIASVSSFIAELLSTPVTESGTVSLASTGASAGSVLDPDTFRALLPTLWFLLGTEHESLLDSLLATYHSQASTHKVKAVLFEFLARAFLLSKVRAASPFTASESERILESLLTAFPRTLWEAANSSSGQAFAGVQLEFLHFLLLLPSPPAKLAYEKLGPLYWIRHPTKNVSVPGPWNKLPPSLRKLALDNITLLQGRDAKLDKALSQALEFAQARS
ncbi:Pre-rRNA-processing protein IPI1/Testis-expressed sequence 10 protein [Kalmanozyma brasiliensis GHG001]|uniref:Pre-rRNA-processing protein IPI1/Testis-expressed sequence 10 protein n=1 Tax=Kalmanozyma brasiliensis (strain GHG001) TaxID=1365824 RepID=UPI0028682DF2|nr:Pre-rRNA-processing protein IPI1/Testis-expressed sequence 10 protein [Kalmanozyma brasiliensis GHG001]EST08922.2 Pre-rRNA-processing protein IPI1/Testis-expressed sequence 10 protein [Kalmanozyma brasiliensis GHG001]